MVKLIAEEFEQHGAREGARGGFRIPEGVREAVGRRLNRLSDVCSYALTVASVIGREFGIDQLARLLDGSSEEDTLSAMHEASAIGLVEETPGEVGRFQFTHPLIQQTLLEELYGDFATRNGLT